MSLPNLMLGGDHWRLSTPNGAVHVWRPAGYRGGQPVVYVHGYYTNVDEAFDGHRLAAQFKASGAPAVFVVPEAPIGNADSVKWPDLPALLAEVSHQTGIALSAPIQVIGHSGAYRTIAKWLDTPGLQNITLLDALYANVADFARWAAGPGRKLVTLSTPSGGTLANSKSIAKMPGVEFVQSAVAHMTLVTSGNFIPNYLQKMVGRAGAQVGLVLLVAVGAAAYLLWR